MNLKKYNIFILFFKKLSFVFFYIDFNVFFNNKFIIIIYVNNIFLTEFNLKHIVAVKQLFNKRFKMIDLNSLRFYININIERNRLNCILFFNKKIF